MVKFAQKPLHGVSAIAAEEKGEGLAWERVRVLGFPITGDLAMYNRLGQDVKESSIQDKIKMIYNLE